VTLKTRSRELSEFHVAQNNEEKTPGSICVAVYRPDSKLLARQIASIRDQTERLWHCHVGIDGPDEGTLSLLRELVAGDERFTVHEFPENVGFYRNFERLLEVVDAATPWVALADQDDFWYPHKIENLLVALFMKDVSLVSGQARLVYRDGLECGVTSRHSRNLAALILNNQVTGSFSVFKLSVLRSALPFPPPTDVAYHDHWLGVVAACQGQVVVVDEVLQDYVQHESNVIGEENAGSQFAKRFRSLAARGAGFRGSIRYIRRHRWGWRVEMAALCLERMPKLDESARLTLNIFANGSISAPLVRVIVRGVLRKDVRPLRGFALLVGAAASPLLGFRPRGVNAKVSGFFRR
jgi:glycosyltransferase involved in cell wall biosynthesis